MTSSCTKCFCGFIVIAAFALTLPGCGDVGTVDRLPTDVTSLFERSQILIERGQFEEAVEVLSKAIALDGTDPRLFTDRGIAYEQLGEDDKAEADYTAAIAVNAKYGRAYNNRAAVRARAKRLEDAIADLSQAIDLDATDLLAFQNRSLALFELGRHDEALADLDRADHISPSNAVNAYRRGQLLRAMGQVDKSLTALDRAIEIAEIDAVGSADMALIRSERARTLRDLNRIEDALAEFRTAAELDPSLGTAVEAQELEGRAAIYAGLRTAGFEIVSGTPPKGFDMSASLAGVSRPVLVAEALNDEEFQLSTEQADLIKKHPDSVVAIANPDGGAALVVQAESLSADNFRPVAFAVRRPDVVPAPQ